MATGIEYLAFRLYGPMASWGSIAVGQERPSDAHPTKSALIGLLAAAMGVERGEEDKLLAMAQGYGLALRVDAPGQLLRDYHTIQTPVEERNIRHHTRRDELENATRLNTILSGREYRCDARYTALVWARDNAPYALTSLASGLKKPRFALYLGRRSCPLALPVAANIVVAEHIAEAFVGFNPPMLPDIIEPSYGERAKQRMYWDEDARIGPMERSQRITRWDVLRSQRRRQFAPRHEWQGYDPQENDNA